MSESIDRYRSHAAARLRRLAHRISPEVTPYGEWDAAKGVLVVKMRGVPLASIEIGAGSIQTDRETQP